MGIDPGLTGALSLVADGKLIEYADMPAIGLGNVSYPFVDGLAVLNYLNDWRPDLVVIEQVASRPKQGVSSTFKFGSTYGSVVGVALASTFPVHLVSPVVWKRRAGLLGTSKDDARLLARKLWPEHADTAFRRKKDSGRADASLIAKFGV